MKVAVFCVFCGLSTVLCRGWALPPPENVLLARNEAILQWSPPSHTYTHTHTPSHTYTHNTSYSVQYSIGEDGVWTDVPGCVNTEEQQCDFRAMATELYGATLRVRAQRDNATSPWQQSGKRVQCVHTASCSPELQVLASPGSLLLQMDGGRRDQSLQNEYGGHLSYRVLYGREGEGMKKFCKSCKSFESSARVEPLPAGERFCVQVRYLLYSKPHGTLSSPECRAIPHSERTKELFLVGSLVAAFSVLVALSVACYCFISRYHTHIKDYMRPIVLPEPLTEFLSGEFAPWPLTNPSSELESHDLISCVEEVKPREEERPSTPTGQKLGQDLDQEPEQHRSPKGLDLGQGQGRGQGHSRATDTDGSEPEPDWWQKTSEEEEEEEGGGERRDRGLRRLRELWV